MRRPPRIKPRGLPTIVEQMRVDLDERFDITPSDASAVFVVIWQSLVEQDLPTMLQKAADLIEVAFNIS
jgi:hypothetical protein